MEACQSINVKLIIFILFLFLQNLSLIKSEKLMYLNNSICGVTFQKSRVDTSVSLGNRTLKVVQTMICLNVLITDCNEMEEELKARMTAENRCCCEIKKIMNYRSLWYGMLIWERRVLHRIQYAYPIQVQYART